MDDHSYRALPTSLVLGLPEVDEQHNELLARIPTLKAKVLTDGHLLKADADELLTALTHHYATEARIAAEFGVDFSKHAVQHDVVLVAVGKTLREVIEGRANVFNLLRYLEYWFERHIAKEDTEFAEEVLEAMRQKSLGGATTPHP